MTHVASTGIEMLDRVLDGIFWGDNVVWESAGADAAAPFVAAAAALPRRLRRGHLGRVRDRRLRPARSRRGDRRHPGGDAAAPEILVERLREACGRSARQLVVLDSLGYSSSASGPPETARFFVQACPMMLGLGAVAVWQLPAGRPEACCAGGSRR